MNVGTTNMVEIKFYGCSRISESQFVYRLSVNSRSLKIQSTLIDNEELAKIIQLISSLSTIRDLLRELSYKKFDYNILCSILLHPVIEFTWIEILDQTDKFDVDLIQHLKQEAINVALNTRNYQLLEEIQSRSSKEEYKTYLNTIENLLLIYKLLKHSCSTDKNHPSSSLSRSLIKPLQKDNSFLTESEKIKWIIVPATKEFHYLLKKKLIRKSLATHDTTLFRHVGLALYSDERYSLQRQAIQSDIVKYSQLDFRLLVKFLFRDRTFEQYFLSLSAICNELFNYKGNSVRYLMADLKTIFLEERHCYIKELLAQGYYFSDNIWKVYFMDNYRVKGISLDFCSIPNCHKTDCKRYLYNAIINHDTPSKICKRYRNLKISLQILDETQVLFIKPSEVRLFVLQLENMKLDNGKKRFSRKTIQMFVSEMRLFFDFLNQENECHNFPNPFRVYKFSNVSSFVKNHEPIPVDVIDQLLTSLPKYNLQMYTFFLVLISTGVRLSDAAGLRTEDLSFDSETDNHFLRFYLRKTAKNSSKRNESNEHRLPITNHLARLLQSVIDKNETIRNYSEENLIFLHKYKRDYNKVIVGGINIPTFNKEVSKCIALFDIKHNGSQWKFSSHQCRKTLATELLSEGASIEQVRAILGHSEAKTTRQYYHTIRDRKLANLDEELFEMFAPYQSDSFSNHLVSQEIDYLKEQLLVTKSLSKDGQGHCNRPSNLSPCSSESCVDCPLLFTGIEKIETWESLFDKQKGLIKELARCTFTDKNFFDQQKSLLNSYEQIISKIYLLHSREEKI